jgi:hypothetical protein
MTEKEEPKKKSTLEDLLRYESVAVASMKEKDDPALALSAMYDFYYKSLGIPNNDPVMGRVFAEAQEGLQYGMQTGNPTITHLGLKQAMGLYHGQYEKAFAESSLGDLNSYLGGVCSIPDGLKSVISKYKDLTYKVLAEKLKDKEASKEIKEEIGKVLQSVNMLKEYKLESSYTKIKKKGIEENLSEMYKPKEKSEDKK